MGIGNALQMIVSAVMVFGADKNAIAVNRVRNRGMPITLRLVMGSGNGGLMLESLLRIQNVLCIIL